MPLEHIGEQDIAAREMVAANTPATTPDAAMARRAAALKKRIKSSVSAMVDESLRAPKRSKRSYAASRKPRKTWPLPKSVSTLRILAAIQRKSPRSKRLSTV